MHLIPPFEKIDVTTGSISSAFSSLLAKVSTPFILRSSITNEGKCDSLMSGKSVSIKKIISLKCAKDAYIAVKFQKDIDEIILQQEIEHSLHLTVMVEHDFFYMDFSGEKKGIYLESERFATGDFPENFAKKLRSIVASLKESVAVPFLLEAGICGERLYLYQIMKLRPEYISKIITEAAR